MSRRLVVVVAVAGSTFGCGGPTTSPAKRRRLESGALARVGEGRILAETVGRIASVQDLDVEAARDLAIRDALFATAAREELPERQVEAVETRVWARALLREFVVSSREGPITEEELGRATETYWTYFARPKGYRTLHAVMLAPEDAPPQTHAAARERIERVREAWEPIVKRLQGTKAPTYADGTVFRWNPKTMTEPITVELEEAAKAAVGTMGLKVQQLPPVTARGYIIDHDQSQSALDVHFSKAASELEGRGDMSRVVQSSSGWHVIVLLETTPARLVGEAERKEALRGFIYRVRAQDRVEALLEERRKDVKVTSNHAALLQLVDVDGEG